MLTLVDPKQIRLHSYQEDAVEALRKGIRQGRKRQVLVAPTGAGKTVIASHLLRQADEKGSYALFLVDRVALVDQTSKTLDRYGIRHGIVQGINDRWSPNENVQVCSIQTLARRSLPRRPSLIIYDECHCSYRSSLTYIAEHPEAVAIGLTATPFTPGMGKHWSGLVNVTTARELINSGYLIEPKIYVARSPEDAELGLNGFGEFSDESAATAGIRIVGDVVAEWMQKTREHFGGPVKTIVFSPSVDHGREVCAAFGAAGFNFQQISYLDRDEAERRAKIDEFRRPDSIIHGLVSCGVLTKGFDVEDVRCGISCKPYRKSLSSHMQEIGRVMRRIEGEQKKAIWLCLAKDSEILTDRGLVRIQFVTKHDKVWDGENFVSHGGAICKGVQNVIRYQGLTATPGHLVHTMDGWRTFGDCAREQIPITQTGFGRTAIRIGKDHLAGRSVAGREAAQVRSRGLRVRDLWLSVSRLAQQFAGWAHKGVSYLQPAGSGISGMALCSGSGAEAPLRQSEEWHVSRLRRPRNRISVLGRQSRDALDHGELGHPRGLQVQGFGPDQSGWALRARQHQVARAEVEPRQSQRGAGHGQDALVQVAAPGGSLRRPHDEAANHDWIDRGPDSGSLASVDLIQEQAEVWDILDAGPRNRFTCNGLLVHNCHSGNIERFAFEMFDVWEHGAGNDLSNAEKRDTKPRERNEETRQKSVCPECSGALRGNFCCACGWERPARSGIVAVEGTMQAFDPAALGLTARAGLRAECVKDPRSVWDAALAYCMDHCPRDENKARRWAYGVWRGVFPDAKLPRGWFDASRRGCDPNAYALIDRETKRFRKQRRAA